MSPRNPIGILFDGPTGPETRRWHDDTWGKTLQDAMAGNDDENVVEKTMIIGKYTFRLATMFCSADIVFFHLEGGLPAALKRVKFHYVPWLGATAAYTMGVSTACSLRGGKTDQWNHVVGGFSAGAVVGKCAKSITTGFFTGALLAAYAYYFKDAEMNNYKAIPDTKPKHGNAFSHKMDFTINKWWAGEKKGYWARTPEEAKEVFKYGQVGDGSYKTTKLW